MPKNTGTSDLFGQAIAAVKGNATKAPGGGSLPAGVEGVAKLTSLKIGEVKSGKHKGKPNFVGVAMAVTPEEFTDEKGNTHRIKGKNVIISEYLFDTPESSRSTLQEHVDWVLNQLRLLGYDTAKMENSRAGLEAAFASLVKVGPYMAYRTWQGSPTKEYPNPRVNTVWEGAVKFDPAQVAKAGVTAAEVAAAEMEPPAPEESEESTDDSEVDWVELGVLSDGGDAEAEARINEKAEELGIAEEVGNAEDWKSAGELIAEALSGEAEEPEDEEGVEEEPEDEGGAEEEPEDGEKSFAELGKLADDGDQEAADRIQEAAAEHDVEDPDTTWEAWGTAIDEAVDGGEREESPFIPEKGDVYLVTPPKGKVPVECEVTSVSALKKTVNLKNLDKGTLYKGIPWDKLGSGAA